MEVPSRSTVLLLSVLLVFVSKHTVTSGSGESRGAKPPWRGNWGVSPQFFSTPFLRGRGSWEWSAAFQAYRKQCPTHRLEDRRENSDTP